MADDINLWVPVITGLITVGAALGGVALTHRFTLQRELRARQEKRDSDRYFIATELVFMLEQFAEGYALVATDNGDRDDKGILRPEHREPALDYTTVVGDWRSLPPYLMYQLRAIPVIKGVVDRHIVDVSEHDSPPDYDDFFFERQYQYVKLGLRAVMLSRRLRSVCAMPATRLYSKEWSAQTVLWRAWREKRHQVKENEIQHRGYIAALRKAEAEQDSTF